MNFQETLASLPPVEHLKRLDLIDTHNQPIASIPNQPGKQGSLRVYHALFQQFGAINPEVAHKGLELFAEHTEAARQHPGSHPNIDLLLSVINNHLTLCVLLVEK